MPSDPADLARRIRDQLSVYADDDEVDLREAVTAGYLHLALPFVEEAAAQKKREDFCNGVHRCIDKPVCENCGTVREPTS